MFLRLRLPQHSAHEDTFFWSEECRNNEVRLYIYIIMIHWLIIYLASMSNKFVSRCKRKVLSMTCPRKKKKGRKKMQFPALEEVLNILVVDKCQHSFIMT